MILLSMVRNFFPVFIPVFINRACTQLSIKYLIFDFKGVAENTIVVEARGFSPAELD